MPKVVCDITVSTDGYVAGPGQSHDKPFGEGPIDELRTHIATVTLGAGERLFDGVPALDLELVSARPASLVTHITYRVRR
ncbi:hypothetical protein [Saccharopolyspora shandongensis]|uniref:hypothetical protein n=1 Tax=Saccharopolyspora shandongensis TaxID=418495 RepID=UPI003408B171